VWWKAVATLLFHDGGVCVGDPDRYTQFDVRVIRNFLFGGIRPQAMFDAYNLFNNTAILSLNSRFGPSWLSPTSVLDARILKLGVQLNF
jgi:hypothetical protein